MNKTVKKAVILAGGKGVRLLPLTKSMAKEVFPVFNKPALQHIVDEVADSGLEDVIIVVNSTKKMAVNHFAKDKKLVEFLEGRGQQKYVEELNKINRIKVRFVNQPKALGSAHALECAKRLLNKGEPFALLNGDDLIFNAKTPATKQLIDCYNKFGQNIIGGQEVTKEQMTKYGMLTGTKKSGRSLVLTDIVEKPKLEEVTSTLAALGRYICNYEIFEEMKKIPVINGERNLTYALQQFAKQGKAVGCNFEGIRYDLGSNFGFVTANIDYALRDKTVGPQLKEYLNKIKK